MERYFEWDVNKAVSNFKKHKIRFEEAVLVFDDPFSISKQDRFENNEERWQTVGSIGGILIILVAHTVRIEGKVEILRIISARPLDKKERSRYEHGAI